jgi:glycosyltransferase involved in cell wall biosynthesis
VIKVSVIVPNYNHSQFLHQRLDSVFNQTYSDYEVILLDDCSTDTSREILDQYRNHPKVTNIVFNEQNSGSTFKQWEKGIQLAKGEYIWIAESDDYCENDFLEILIKKLDQFPNTGMAYCQSVSVDSQNRILNSWTEHTKVFVPNIWHLSFYLNGQTAIKEFFLYRNVIPNASALVFRKSFYKSTSGFETQMKLNGDWFFWIKMLEISDLIYIAKSLNYFRYHENKVTNSNCKNFNNLVELCEIYRYLQCKICLSINQKREMTKTILRFWIFQMYKARIIISLQNLPRITKSVYSINSVFYMFLIPVTWEIIKMKLSHKYYEIVLTPNLKNFKEI